jgi:hypothetical protein
MLDQGPKGWKLEERFAMLFCGLGLQANWGEDVTHFCARLALLAKSLGQTVVGIHNDFPLWAVPGMTGSEVLKPWDDWQRAEYFRR